MTGSPIEGCGDAIWDEGEWISWDYINQQLEGPVPEGGLVEDMIALAKSYLEETGRHLTIYGELGIATSNFCILGWMPRSILRLYSSI